MEKRIFKLPPSDWFDLLVSDYERKIMSDFVDFLKVEKVLEDENTDDEKETNTLAASMFIDFIIESFGDTSFYPIDDRQEKMTRREFFDVDQDCKENAAFLIALIECLKSIKLIDNEED